MHRLVAGMAPAILASIVSRRLPTQPVEPVVNPVGSAVDRINHAIRRNVGAGIEVRRTVIVQIDLVDAAGMAVMVPDVHVRIGGK